MSDALVNGSRDACASALAVLPLPALTWLHGRLPGGTFVHTVAVTAWLRKAMRRMAASHSR